MSINDQEVEKNWICRYY